MDVDASCIRPPAAHVHAQHAQANARLCRAKPHVVIVPVVVAGLMMGLGVWAVLQGADAQADSQRCATTWGKSRCHLFSITWVKLERSGGLRLTWLPVRRARPSCRREAQSQVDAAASSLQLTIERAIQPVVRVADWVKHRRTWAVIRDTWQERLDDWVDPVRPSRLGPAQAGHSLEQRV